MSRQGLIDRWGVGYVFEHARGGSTSPLFIVRVRTFRPDTGRVIAILVRCCQMSHPAHAGMLPNDVILPTQEWLFAIYCTVLPNDVRVQRSLYPRIGHFLTTVAHLRHVVYAGHTRRDGCGSIRDWLQRKISPPSDRWLVRRCWQTEFRTIRRPLLILLYWHDGEQAAGSSELGVKSRSYWVALESEDEGRTKIIACVLFRYSLQFVFWVTAVFCFTL